MGRRVFNTSGASDEEREGLRQALSGAGIAFYETHAGFWGVGTPALWIHDSAQYDTARAVIDAFEQEWGNAMSEESGSYLSQINWRLVPAFILLIGAVIWMCLAFFRFG